VGSVQCALVEWKKERGQFRPVPREDAPFVLPAELLLLALGFTGAQPGPLLESLGAEPDPSGRLPRDAAGRLSGRRAGGRDGRGLYVCGDAALGPSLVVRAINDGLHVARTALEDYGLSSLVSRNFA
jgi:glutamate synthase (NADPH/NADH) small chain